MLHFNISTEAAMTVVPLNIKMERRQGVVVGDVFNGGSRIFQEGKPTSQRVR